MADHRGYRWWPADKAAYIWNCNECWRNCLFLIDVLLHIVLLLFFLSDGRKRYPGDRVSVLFESEYPNLHISGFQEAAGSLLGSDPSEGRCDAAKTDQSDIFLYPGHSIVQAVPAQLRRWHISGCDEYFFHYFWSLPFLLRYKRLSILFGS